MKLKLWVKEKELDITLRIMAFTYGVSILEAMKSNISLENLEQYYTIYFECYDIKSLNNLEKAFKAADISSIKWMH